MRINEQTRKNCLVQINNIVAAGPDMVKKNQELYNKLCLSIVSDYEDLERAANTNTKSAVYGKIIEKVNNMKNDLDLAGKGEYKSE